MMPGMLRSDQHSEKLVTLANYLCLGAGLRTSVAAQRRPTLPPLTFFASSGLVRLETSPLPVNRWDSLLLTSIRMRELGLRRGRDSSLPGFP